MKLAKERGNLGTIHGDPASSRLDRKRGGKAKHRAHGGKVGSDEHPYTSAGKHHKEPEGKHSYNHGAEEHKGHTHEGRK
jgi:hypothetical protein